MRKIETSNQLGGRAIGSIFFAGFGALWLFLALYAEENLTATSISLVALGLAMLLTGGIYLLGQSKRWPKTPDDPAIARTFKWVNIVQWVAVGVVAFTLAKLRLDAYVMSAITAIVGIHLFPLARVFRYPMHYVNGAVLVAWAGASAVFVPTETMQSVAAMGTGAILWLAAAVTLGMAFVAARKSPDTAIC
jgi:hypothetical protein